MTMQTEGNWTRDMIEALRKMHDDGLSMSQISSQFNRQSWEGYDIKMTRSAVRESPAIRLLAASGVSGAPCIARRRTLVRVSTPTRLDKTIKDRRD